VLTQSGYIERIIDTRIDFLLKGFGAVCIEGSKWCGKTWTSLNHANSVYYVDDPSGDFQNRRLAELDPLYAMEGDIPHVIDEWQEVPGLWDATRFAIDREQGKGRFLLTGSSVPPRKTTLHTGAGRIARIRMRPMSLSESGESTGDVSLSGLFKGEFSRHSKEIDLDTIIRLACRGGWPGSLGLDQKLELEISKQYVNLIEQEDMSRVDGIKRDPQRVSRLLRSLARNNMTMATNKTLIKDTQESTSSSLSEPTLISYVGALQKLFIIEDMLAWNPKLRSTSRLRVASKKHFVDPSLAIAALSATPKMMKADLNTFGFMFENMAVRDLKIYADALGGNVYHYHDSEGLEADCIIESAEGEWGAIEIKLGVGEADYAAESLLRLEKKIVAGGGRPPAFLAVICGVCDYSYTREDGVLVIPLTALGA
jgi:predicted AAA+ superfamily ATPase